MYVSGVAEHVCSVKEPAAPSITFLCMQAETNFLCGVLKIVSERVNTVSEENNVKGLT